MKGAIRTNVLQSTWKARHEQLISIDRATSLHQGREFRAKSTSADVLVGQGLPEAVGGGLHRAPQQQGQLGQEGLPEDAPLLLQPAATTANQASKRAFLASPNSYCKLDPPPPEVEEYAITCDVITEDLFLAPNCQGFGEVRLGNDEKRLSEITVVSMSGLGRVSRQDSTRVPAHHGDGDSKLAEMTGLKTCLSLHGRGNLPPPGLSSIFSPKQELCRFVLRC
jgi:hypothetical protein